MERPSAPEAGVPGVDGDGLAAGDFVAGPLAGECLAAVGFVAGAFSATVGGGATGCGAVTGAVAVAGAGSECGRINSHPRIASTTTAIAPCQANGRRLVTASSSSSTSTGLTTGIGGVLSRSAIGGGFAGGAG